MDLDHDTLFLINRYHLLRYHLIALKNGHIYHSKITRDMWTDQRMDGLTNEQMDGGTDTTFYKDA